MVLHLNSVADVDEFLVFEHQEVGQACQLEGSCKPLTASSARSDTMSICVLKTAMYGVSAEHQLEEYLSLWCIYCQ